MSPLSINSQFTIQPDPHKSPTSSNSSYAKQVNTTITRNQNFPANNQNFISSGNTRATAVKIDAINNPSGARLTVELPETVSKVLIEQNRSPSLTKNFNIRPYPDHVVKETIHKQYFNLGLTDDKVIPGDINFTDQKVFQEDVLTPGQLLNGHQYLYNIIENFQSHQTNTVTDTSKTGSTFKEVYQLHCERELDYYKKKLAEANRLHELTGDPKYLNLIELLLTQIGQLKDNLKTSP